MTIDPAEQVVRLDRAGVVACAGNHPSTGHPKVYYPLEAGQTVLCQYCGCIFVCEALPASSTRPASEVAG